MKKSVLIITGAVLTLTIIGLLAFNQPEKAVNKPESIKAPPVPTKLSFAGEDMPMNDFDVRERFDRELMINTFWHSQTLFTLKKTRRFLPTMEAILKKNGVPDDFKYLAVAESGLANVTSPAKAEGFWQFLESSVKRYGLEINEEVDERYHLEKATEAACKYLTESKNKLGNWTLAAAAYNMGDAGVSRAVESQGVKNYYDLLLNTETARYLFRITAIKEIYSNPAKYGFVIDSADYYPTIATYTVTVDSAIDNLAQYAIGQGINYKVLKLLNPWLRKPYLKNKAKKTYTITLPKDKSFISPAEGTIKALPPAPGDENTESIE
jgi:membrane-bound lytic murein transglycosylase D